MCGRGGERFGAQRAACAKTTKQEGSWCVGETFQMSVGLEREGLRERRQVVYDALRDCVAWQPPGRDEVRRTVASSRPQDDFDSQLE